MENRVLRMIPAVLIALTLFLSAVSYGRLRIATRLVDWLEEHRIIGRTWLLVVSTVLVVMGVLALLKEAGVVDLSTEGRYPRH